MTEQTPSKPWYKKWWGVVLTVLFFPFVVPYLVWTKTTWNKWVKVGITVFCAIFIVNSMAGSKKVDQTSIQNKPTIALTNVPQSTNTVDDVSPTLTEEDKPTPTIEERTIKQNELPKTRETLSQKNAISKAKSYLNYSAFSYTGLVKQLEYEQYSNADAVYGADNCGANWNEQATKKAKSYMDYSAYSRGGLIDQLIYEGFTQEQAEFGVNAVGL